MRKIKHSESEQRKLSSGLSLSGAQEISRTAQRLSWWANPTHMQWKDINTEVTTAMVKEIWPCSDSEIKKGRWKISKCLHDEIKAKAEMITLEVFGHPLHNADAPLYFAKMLYMQFILERPIDFSSKEQILTTGDIRASSVTLTREELQLALQSANLQLLEEKDILKRSLVAKE